MGKFADEYNILKNNEDPRQTQSVEYIANNFQAAGTPIAGEVEADAGKDTWI